MATENIDLTRWGQGMLSEEELQALAAVHKDMAKAGAP
jgi:hypothetical protein